MFGLTTALIGMGIVFSELIFLVFVTQGVTAFAKGIEAKKNPKNSVSGVDSPRAEVAAAAPSQEAGAEDDNVAAVIAAIVAYMSQGTMSVKTIVRLPGSAGSAWSMAGRQETMNLRQM